MGPLAELRRIARRQHERLQRARRQRAPLTAHDDAIRAAVQAAADDAGAMSAALVRYFWRHWQHYASADGTRADYPGWPSIYGAASDAVEGVSRPAPLWAAWAASPASSAQEREAMLDALRRTLVYGTDPAHRGYWGPIGHRSTLICEAADLALALWLARDTLWGRLSIAERGRILGWLAQAVGKRTADNNWHLFVVLVDAVLAALDPQHRFASGDRLQRVRAFARGDGCFVDGPTGAVDFYNAWGFHYLLFWLGEIDPGLLDHPLRLSLAEFCRWYQWLFTPRGVPLFGRSLCYRFAACAPMLACALREPQEVPPGVAVSAYLANWQHFVREGALRAGRPTQGVFGEDMRWLDPYSGPASSLWGTRSIVMFLHAGRWVDWAHTAPQPLPATREDVDLGVPALGAHVLTRAAQGTCSVVFDGGRSPQDPPTAQRQRLADRWREALHGIASRPANNLQKAGHLRFDSTLQLYK